jgi:hypothetical protein
MTDTIQHFRVKLFADETSQPNLHQAIPVFHRWIREKLVAETPIDVSDYLHVPAGPGVILVCHDAIYGLDQERNRLGLLYNRRTVLNGSAESRLLQAVNAIEQAAHRLEGEPEFNGQMRFDRSQWEVVVNDRALAPNTSETLAALEPVIRSVFGSVFDGPFRMAHVVAPAELFRVRILPA